MQQTPSVPSVPPLPGWQLGAAAGALLVLWLGLPRLPPLLLLWALVPWTKDLPVPTGVSSVYGGCWQLGALLTFRAVKCLWRVG